MKLVVYVLVKPDSLQTLLAALNKANVKGATILNSTGMGRELMLSDENIIFGSLRKMLSNNARESRTLLVVAEDGQVTTITQVIEKVVGKLEGPDSGILFTLPIDSVKGFKK